MQRLFLLFHSAQFYFTCDKCDNGCLKMSILNKHLKKYHTGICRNYNFFFNLGILRKYIFITHQKEMVPNWTLLFLWIQMHNNWWTQQTHDDTFRREVFHLHALWVFLHTSWYRQMPHAKASWRETLQL